MGLYERSGRMCIEIKSKIFRILTFILHYHLLAAIVLVIFSGQVWADFIEGTDGPDIIYLYPGNDTCYGEPLGSSDFGDDEIYGRDGNDTIYGEYPEARQTDVDAGSNDYLDGGDGDDELYGDSGELDLRDQIPYVIGNDTIIGGKGHDKLYGFGGSDYLDGGEGNDFLHGGIIDNPGNNTLLGGPGDDILKSGHGTDILDGGDGYDIVDYSWMLNTDIIVDLSKGTMRYGVLPDIVSDTLAGIEEVRGSLMSDTLIGDHNDNKLYGDYINDPNFSGDDILEGGLGNDTLIGNQGNDTARYSNAPSSVTVNLETNTASGGDGNDTLNTIENVIGSGYADVLIGNSVNNVLSGGAGDDLLQGKSGVDTLYGGEDNDTLEGGTGNDYGEGQQGDDTLDGGEGDDELYGDSTTPIVGAGNDTLYGRAGNDELYGGEGDDIVDGGLGDDGIYDVDGNDQLFGGSGEDDLRGGDGNDLMHGGADNDRLYGQRLHQTSGLNDDDIIFGGTGDDSIEGDYSGAPGGKDYLNGGDGNDTIRGCGGRDILVGGRGNDNLDGGYIALDSDIDIVSEFADTNFTLADTQLSGLGLDNLFGIEGANLRGGNSENVLDASTFTKGSVTLYGEKGNDTLRGGTSDDILVGTGGGSFTPGLGEQDTLEGGPGADRFILGDADWFGYDDNDITASGENDYARIIDFNPNDDVIQLQGAQTDYIIDEPGTDTRLLINKPGEEPDELVAIIEGVTGLSLNSSAFLYVPPAPPGPEMVVLGNDYEIVNGSFSPTTYDHTYFGSAHISDSTITRTFTILNTGSTDLNLTGSIQVALNGVHAADFAVIEQPSSPILPGESAAFQIQFDPSDLGIRYATVAIENNDSDENPYTFTIHGTGYNEQSIIDSDNDGIPDELEIITCTVPADADSDDDGISDGDEDTNHDGVVDWDETDPCDRDTDNDGVQDGTELGLTAPIEGTDSNIFIADQDPASTTDPLNRDTDGDGFTDGQEDRNYNGRVDTGETDPNVPTSVPNQEAIIEVTPTFLDFGNVYVGAFSILTVTITNVGYADLTISGVQFGGTTSQDYTIISNPAPITLKSGQDIPVGESTTVEISYTPRQIDSDSGTLEILSNDPNNSVTTLTLSGSGISGEIEVTPNPLNFGSTYIGNTTAETIVITNVGSDNIDITNLEISGTSHADFVIQSNPAPFTLIPNENATLNITYTPDQSEVDIAKLEIHTTGQTNSIVPVILSGTGCGGLGTPINSNAGYRPAAIAVGDLNKDNILDLATADEGTDSFAVMLGNGDGTFQFSPEYSVGDGPGAIAIDDLNSDGNLDVVVADSWATTVSAFLGNGAGEFTSTGSFQAGTFPESLAIGDFNSDTFPDLAVINQFGNGVSILMGNGDGTFGPANSFSSGTYCHSIDVGDFNGDNALDLVVSSSGVAIHLGNNDGTFRAPVVFSGGRDSVAVGDLNGDTILDLAFAGGGGIIVQLGNGDGTFTNLASWSYYGAEFIAIGDFNYDNIPDLAVDCELLSDRYEAVFLGNGDGTFGSGFNFTNSGSEAASIAVGDFNNDQGIDLVVVNKYSDNVSVFLNQCPAPSDYMDIDVVPLGMNYGDVEEGSASPLSFKISNTGTADLTVIAIALGGGTSGDFSITSGPTLPVVIAPGSNVTVDVTYSPSDLGSDTGTVEIVSDDSDEALVTVSLAGNGVSVLVPEIDVVPLSLDYGDVNEGGSSPLSITISNTGTADLTLSNIALGSATSGDFAITSVPILPVSIASGANVTVDVTYSPSDLGSDTGTVEIVSDDIDEALVTVSLAGNGVPGIVSEIDVAPLSLNYGDVEEGAASALSLTISNTGTADLTVANIALGTGTSGDFAITSSPTLPVVITSGSNVTVDVTYSPSDLGSDTGTVEIVSDDADEALVTVSLSGNGVMTPAPEITVSGNGHEIPDGDTTPNSVDDTDFGAAGGADGGVTHTFSITNSGLAALNLTGIPHVSISGAHANDFSVTLQPNSPVAASDTTTFDIQFSPNAEGLREAIVNIANDDSDENPYNFAIQGFGSSINPAIAGRSLHSIAIQGGDGSLWVWGFNNKGQLGDGSQTNQSVPTFIDSGYSAIAGGRSHSVGLKYDGSLYAWGDNTYGQLGDGTTTAQLDPTIIGSSYSAVAAGAHYSLALKNDGSLWTWGYNWQGQLGDGTTTDSSVPILIGTDYIAIAAGEFHSLALKNDGSLWGWGENNWGQLGDGTKTDRLVPTFIGNGYSAIAGGWFHSLALKNDGSLWAWGDNDWGQLGTGTIAEQLEPTLIGSGYSAIAAGDYYSLALKNDGSLWSWGRNSYGQLGDGTTTRRLAPVHIGSGYNAVAVGYGRSLALKNDSSLWAWGRNNYGQLGDGTTTDRLVPTLIFSEGFTFSTHELVVATAGDGSGSVTSQPQGIDCGTGCRATFSNGTEIMLTPVAETDSTFTGWSGACSGTDVPCSFILDATKYVTASFSHGSAEIDVAPLSLSYGDVEEGTASALNLTISNTGVADLNVTDIDLGSGTSADFTITSSPSLPISVVPGANVTVEITYSPSDLGSDTGTVEIVSDDADEGTLTVSLSGNGVSVPVPEINVAPLSLNYGDVEEGAASALNLTITNTGTADLTVSNIALGNGTSGDFAITSSPSIPLNVAPGANVTVEVTYSPSDLGSDTGTVEIVSDDTDEGTVTVSLSGNGVPVPVPEIVIAPLSLSYGDVEEGASSPLSITVSNTGTADLTVSNITLGTGTSGDFAITSSPSIPLNVAPGANVTVEVTYSPSDLGSDTGTVEIVSDDADETTVTVSLSGNGVPVPVPEISIEGNGVVILDGDTTPSSADHTDFGNADVETDSISRSFTIRNMGTASLSLTGTPMVTLSGIHVGDFSVTAQPTSPIAPGDSTTFQVDFDPSAAGLRQATISISNNDSDENPYDFNIQGTGINSNLPPMIESLTNTPEPVIIGASLMLTANGVSDPNPDDTLTTHFYRESNGITGLQVGQDTLVGTDTDPANGWTVNIPTSGLTAGSYTYYAQVTDAAGLTSPVVATTSEVQLLDLKQVGHWGGATWAVEIEGTIAYVGQGQSFLILDISQPTAPLEMGRVILPQGVTDIVVSGAYAYVAIGYGGLQVVDISTPSSPIVVGTYDAWYVRAVDVSGDFAYLIEDSQGFEVLDISNPLNPVHVGDYDDTNTTYDVVVSGNFAYVAYGYGGLKVFDISVPASPVQVGSYQYSHPDGASDKYWSVALDGNYLFLTAEATPGSRKSLYVVDISLPSNPIHTGVYDTTGINYTYITVFGDYAYLSNRTNGFEIIDISVPSNPTQVAKYNTDGDGTVSDVAVSGNYAYIADGSNGLQVFDISTPSSPVPMAVATDSNSCLRRVVVSGNYVYTGGGLSDAGLHLLDNSTPSQLTRVGFYGEGKGDVFAVSGDYAYIRSSNDGLEVIDFSTPSNPIQVGSVVTSYWWVTDVATLGNYAFVTVQQGGLDVIDISMPSNPVLVGNYNTTGLANGVAVSGNYAYVADDSNGLQVIDISSPSSPVRIGGCNTGGYANRIAVKDNHAYIAEDTGLQVVDITDPAHPVCIGNYNTHYAYDIAVSGNYAYLATSGSGLYVIDISEPSNPSLAGSFDTAGQAYGVTISDNYAYIADCSNGLVILNGVLGHTQKPDEDGDGLSDELENSTCTDPIDVDTDDDGLADGAEDANHNGAMDPGETDPCDIDTDGDGIQDGTELGITQPIPDPDGTGPLLGTDPSIFQPDFDPSTTTNPSLSDSDGDGIDDGVEDSNYDGQIDDWETDPSDTLSYPEAIINLEKGLNLVAIHAQGNLRDWLPVLGDSSVIEKVMIYDNQTGTFTTLIPEDPLNPSINLNGIEGLIVYATIARDMGFASVVCPNIDLHQGFNLLGFGCPREGYSAFQLLNALGNQNVSSIQRYSMEKGAFETAGFTPNGLLAGIDFPIIPGQGYLLYMKQEVLGFQF